MPNIALTAYMRVRLFTSHALKELANDGLSIEDARGVLRGGAFDGCDLILGSWRYRLRKVKTYVVVAFEAETRTAVITAWRKR
jgi:hypothetical protein